MSSSVSKQKKKSRKNKCVHHDRFVDLLFCIYFPNFLFMFLCSFVSYSFFFSSQNNSCCMETNNNGNNELLENEFEKRYVHDVYVTIADHCLKRKPKPLDFVVKFSKYVTEDSVILDIGCGNCRNQSVFKNSLIIGCDVVRKFVEECYKPEELRFCLLADYLYLYLKPETFDVCLFIGVLHHISTEKRRFRILEKLKESLTKDGIAIIASAGHAEGKKNVVMGDNIEYHRYFHYFVKGELENMCIKTGFIILEHEVYSEGMWHLIVKK